MSTITKKDTSDLRGVLRDRFGLSGFRAGQEAVIQRLLDGRSAAAVFPTGGGKSLCYQLPAVLLEGLTLVVSPLLALMREQVDSLAALGIAAARLDSTLSAAEVREVTRRVREGEVQMLYVAPERFFNERFREFISGQRIALFAIDEAHCISQWGHNFRPDYLKLARLAKALKVERTLALTATATPTVLDDIRAGFGIAPEDAVQTPFYRENLTLRFTHCDPQQRERILIERLKGGARGAAVVYVSLQKTAESVAQALQSAGLQARAYHAGLDDETRRAVQDWFMQSTDGIVVATIAFGMGIDKSNIRAILHYNPSKSIENLAQEIGRAGRDDEPAVCETLLIPADRVVLENFTYGDTPSAAALRTFVEVLAGQPTSFFISYYSLAFEADIRDSVVRTLLTHLELAGVLEATSPRYESYEFKPRVASAEILRHFQDERREFAASVLALTVKKKIWYSINLAQAANRLKCDRQRIVKMLDYFAEQDWIELRVSGLVHGYRKLQPIKDIEELSQELHQVVMDRELSELTRLDELFELMVGDECQSAALSQHFGQSLAAPCGHCSACEGQAIGGLPEPDYPSVGDSAITALQRLRKEHPEALADVRQSARFLCGLSSPKLTRARLTRHPQYGCCSQIPFDRVIESLVGT